MATLVIFELNSSDRGDTFSVNRELMSKLGYKDNVEALADNPHMVLPFPMNSLLHIEKSIKQAVADVKDAAHSLSFSVNKCVAVEFTVSQGIPAPPK